MNLAALIKGEMREESSTTSQLSDAMTTKEETSTTGGNTMTSSSSPGSEFYFHLAVVVIGVIGTAANALILYALVASKQHKKHVLIVNQNALDLFSCIFLIITYSVKLCSIRLIGWIGYWLCVLILTDNILWCGIVGSTINLATITIERYIKVVHNTKVRNWIIYSAIAFAWIGSIVCNAVAVLLSSDLINGICYVFIFKNKSDQIIYFFWHFASFYLIILLIFIICYGRILHVIRRQAKIMSSHNAASTSTATTQSNQRKINVIKTMILVSGSFAVMWLPNHISALLILLSPNPKLDSGYYVSLFIAFLYICCNPFIYATKFDPVKEILIRMIPCKKTNVVSIDIGMVTFRNGPAGHARVNYSNQCLQGLENQ